MRLLLPILVALLLLPIQAKADTPSVVADQNVTIIDYIWDGFHQLPNLKEGAMLDIAHSRVLNTLSVEVINGGYFGSFWKNFSLAGSYIGTDGIGAGADFSLNGLPVSSVPIVQYLKYGYVGYGVGYRTLTANTDDPTQKSDNQFIQGIRFGAKLNF